MNFIIHFFVIQYISANSSELLVLCVCVNVKNRKTFLMNKEICIYPRFVYSCSLFHSQRKLNFLHFPKLAHFLSETKILLRAVTAQQKAVAHPLFPKNSWQNHSERRIE